ncbi:MAG: hypothetical protein QOG64_865, partial [Acidimicrobiaceae bacterium]|nr:hypothetical protein [Acidimicrobiaceae bacterium]
MPSGEESRDAAASAAALLLAGADEIATEWRELCRWDPALPPESSPPIASAVIVAMAHALGRPQPLGWGPDPEVEKVIEVFATAVGSIEPAIGQLVCLREAVRRYLGERIRPEEAMDATAGFNMVVDRAIGLAASRTAERLRDDAVVDRLTGLPNSRALQRDGRREIGRAERYRRRLALMVLDLAGLGAINAASGYPAGDEVVCRLARAIEDVLRVGDTAYRADDDQFALLLPEAGGEAESLAQRVEASDAPAFTWGMATFPDDGDTVERLMAVADERR